MSTPTSPMDTTTACVTPGGPPTEPAPPMDEDAMLAAAIAEAAADPERRPLIDIVTTAMKVVDEMSRLSMGGVPLGDSEKAKRKEWDRAYHALQALKHRGDKYLVSCRQALPQLPEIITTQLFISEMRTNFKMFINPAKCGLFTRAIIPMDLLASIASLDADLENLDESITRYKEHFKPASASSRSGTGTGFGTGSTKPALTSSISGTSNGGTSLINPFMASGLPNPHYSGPPIPDMYRPNYEPGRGTALA